MQTKLLVLLQSGGASSIANKCRASAAFQKVPAAEETLAPLLSPTLSYEAIPAPDRAAEGRLLTGGGGQL